MTSLRTFTAAALAACAITASSVSPGAAAPDGEAVNPPSAYVVFCTRHQADCQPSNGPAKVMLTGAGRAELERVNHFVNASVNAMTDIDLYGAVDVWAYAQPTFWRWGNGDCEDYVLEKRRMLIERGWPAPALRIAVVLQVDGSGHAVLLVATDKGDLVLDNLSMRIVRREEAPYVWHSRQSAEHPLKWVAMEGYPHAAK